MSGGNIYKDISKRTDGDIYLGVVGPVRTGKSTFIKSFMDLMVLPNIDNDYSRERTKDELPQSAGGKTIMTTEPKFIPNEGVDVSLSDGAKMRVKMIDCVGYLIPGAIGHTEDDEPRMVKTPWSDEPIPFTDAAEIGTKKVICDHSTIGIVVTTDGSITDIPREDYVQSEERVINELKEINKPFVIILNTRYPDKEETIELCRFLSENYCVPVLPVNCAKLSKNTIDEILKTVLYRFPISEIGINVPSWINSLCDEHWLKKDIYDEVLSSLDDVVLIDDIKKITDKMCLSEHFEKAEISSIDLGSGKAVIDLISPQKLFYEILKEESGFEIDGDDKLISLLSELSEMKKEYDKIKYALCEVYQKGYGIVAPSTDELRLEEPEIVRQGSRFGVKLKASAPSIHMIRADIETEVSPIVGTEKQSEELVHYLLKEFETDPKKIWDSNIFGKSLYELVNEGLHNKLYRMPDDAQFKLQETLQKIINEGSGGLICIIL